MNENAFPILMAEDNEHDIIATRRAWQKYKISNPLVIVNDGEECLDYLYCRGSYADNPEFKIPGILLLDINMPRMDGITVLKNIRSDKRFCRLPVIMLTTSKADEDKIRSYDLNANAYIVKPVGFDNFAEAVNMINVFWRMVELPVL